MKSISLIILLLPLSVFAGQGEVLLNKFLNDTSSMSAKFVQTMRSDSGELLQETSGDFYLLRPDKFRWNYTQPYQQQIVSNGELVWMYDVDLEQVTVQKPSQTLKNTPMALVQGTIQLDEAFVINELDNRGGVYRIKLTSKSGDADFSELILGVDSSGLQFMEMRDQFEQTTDIIFMQLESNIKLDDELFDFVAPDGVDVFGGS